MSNSASNVRFIAETAIAAAVAYVLNFIPNNIAQTFYIEFAVIPIILLALRRGVAWGMLGGLVFGLLILITGQGGNMVLKTPLLQYADGIIEYILAPLSLGLAGFFHKKKLTLSTIIFAAFLAAIAKYFWHFVAGAIFWASYTPKGWNLWLFSLVTQGISGILTGILAAILLILLFKANSRIFTN